MVFVEVTTGKNPDTGRTETTKTESNFFGVKTNPKSDEVQAGLYASDTVLVLTAREAFRGRLLWMKYNSTGTSGALRVSP